MKIRELERREIADVWKIDRAEVVDRIYVVEGGALVLKSQHFDIKGWSPDTPEQYGPILLDCFDRGGTFYGAFDDDGSWLGLAVLESRFIGRAKDQLQLVFFHVSRRARRTGVGRLLFDKALTRARELGARRLYVSATGSENTINVYLHLGCRLTDDIDPELFALEPEDIHLEYDIPVSVTGSAQRLK